MENLFRDLSVSADETAREEEALRLRVRELSDAQRKTYYERVKPRLRDPDTYAVLNWLLVGAHHLYLGRWFRGIFNLVVVGVALLLLFAGAGVASVIGFALLAAVAVVELAQLFRSQTIVADYNNQQARAALEQLDRHG